MNLEDLIKLLTSINKDNVDGTARVVVNIDGQSKDFHVVPIKKEGGEFVCIIISPILTH
jgi:hypothetical protein